MKTDLFDGLTSPPDELTRARNAYARALDIFEQATLEATQAQQKAAAALGKLDDLRREVQRAEATVMAVEYRMRRIRS